MARRISHECNLFSANCKHIHDYMHMSQEFFFWNLSLEYNCEDLELIILDVRPFFSLLR